MYKNVYQRGLLTVLFSCGSRPLNIWDTYVKDGYITRFLDKEIKSMVLEIGGTNVSTTYITCPKAGNNGLAIKLPFLVMVVKNLKKYFSFEVTILDDTGARRRFRISNFQSSTQIMPMCTVMPIGLAEGWNQIQFNLSDFTKRAYKKQFIEVVRLKINANIRVRRIYFAERLIPDEQLPPEYKLFFPLGAKSRKPKKLPVVEKPTDVPQEETKAAEGAEQKAVPSEAEEVPTEAAAVETELVTAEVPTAEGEPAAEGELAIAGEKTEEGEQLLEGEPATEGEQTVEKDKTEAVEEEQGPEGEPIAEEPPAPEGELTPAAESETAGEAHPTPVEEQPVEVETAAEVEAPPEMTEVPTEVLAPG